MTSKKGKSTRTYTQAESRLLAEWVAKYHPTERVLFHVYVGEIDPSKITPDMSPGDRAMMGNTRRWVDAVIIYQNHVELVEAKIITTPYVVAQMELYLDLFPKTLELGAARFLPVQGVILAAVTDPAITTLIRRRGYDEIIFTPDWIKGYLETRMPRTNRPGVVSG